MFQTERIVTSEAGNTPPTTKRGGKGGKKDKCKDKGGGRSTVPEEGRTTNGRIKGDPKLKNYLPQTEVFSAKGERKGAKKGTRYLGQKNLTSVHQKESSRGGGDLVKKKGDTEFFWKMGRKRDRGGGDPGGQRTPANKTSIGQKRKIR